jgi:hypothetical protein
MKSKKEIEEYIEKLQSTIDEKQLAIIDSLEGEYALDVLFEFAIIYESYFLEYYDRNSGMLQLSTFSLAHLLRKIFKRQKKWSRELDDVEQIHVRIVMRLLQNIEKSTEETIIWALLYYESLRAELDNIKDILYDRSCKVTITPDGKLSVENINEAGLRNELKTQLKYPFQTSYYNFSAQVRVEEMINVGLFKPQGGNEMARNASEPIKAQEIATRAFLDHYGIEEEFIWRGEHYQASLLVRLLSSLIYSFQSSYGQLFAQQGKKLPFRQKIFDTIIDFINKGVEEIPGPLFLCALSSFYDRTINNFSEIEAEILRKHIDFFRYKLGKNPDELQLAQTPLLQIGNYLAIFVRPLMLQNAWFPLVQKLIGNPGDKGESGRSMRAANRLGSLFKDRGFHTLVEENILKKEGKDVKTDIDIAAFKDNHLFLLQLKMTRPKLFGSEYKSHLEDALKVAYRQNRKVCNHLEANWSMFKRKLGTTSEWKEITKHLIVVSTSFEGDRRAIFKESLKISQFELERYLLNDAYLMLDEDKMEIPDALKKPFYSKKGLTGKRLWELIESDALWSFLNKKVEIVDLQRHLPTFDPADIEKV